MSSQDTHAGFTKVGILLLLPYFAVTSQICIALTDRLLVIMVYGTEAFFEHGLRIVDSKHAILSNGEKITGWWRVARMAITGVPMCAALVAYCRCRYFFEWPEKE